MAMGEANPKIDAMILGDRESPEPYLVYADWLQERGDPLGDFIALHYQVVTTNGSLDPVAAFVEQHSDYLLGPIPPDATPIVHMLDERLTITIPMEGVTYSPLGFTFRWGLAERAFLTTWSLEAWTELLRRPAYRFLQECGLMPTEVGYVASLIDNLSDTQRTSMRAISCSSGTVGEADAEAIASLNLRNLALYSVGGVDDSFLEAVFPHPTIHRVSLSQCSAVTRAGITHVASERLTSLLLDVMPQIVNDDGLEAVGGARNLTELSISPCHDVTNAGRNAVAGLPLQSFHARGFPELDASLVHWLAGFEDLETFQLIVDRRGPLAHVDFYSDDMYELGGDESRDMLEALSGLRSLYGFRVQASSTVSAQDISFLVEHSEPQAFELFGTPLATPQLIAQLAQCDSLRALFVWMAPLLTTEDFAVFRGGELDCLALMEIPALTGDVLHYFAGHPMQRLHLPAMVLLDSEWDALVRFETLEELYVPCEGWNDERLNTLLDRNPNLSRLSIAGPCELSRDTWSRLGAAGLAEFAPRNLQIPAAIKFGSTYINPPGQSDLYWLARGR